MKEIFEKIEIGAAIISAIGLVLYALPYVVAVMATVLYYLGLLKV
jgi:hypothetical protein